MGLRYLKSTLCKKNNNCMDFNKVPKHQSTTNLKKYPWLKLRKNYDAGMIGLHQEIVDFYRYMRPTGVEFDMRNDVVTRVQNLITNKWPYAIVEVFGSFRTGLYLPTSDIDFVAIGKWARVPLQSLRDELLKNRIAVIDSIQLIDKAAVPIIKFTDAKTRIQVDISFNIVNGIKSAEVILEFMKQYPILPPLIMAIKQFLNQRQLNEVFLGGLSSYSIILLTVSFIQLHPRFKTMLDGYFANVNLGVLLIEFFELYGCHFNYNVTGIRVDPYTGSSYFPKRSFGHEESWTGSTSMLCIEDPLLKGNDIAKSSFAFYRVKQAFEYAYVALTRAVTLNSEAPPDSVEDWQSVLGQVLSVPTKLQSYRKWALSKFASNMAPDPNDNLNGTSTPFDSGTSGCTLRSSEISTSFQVPNPGCSSPDTVDLTDDGRSQTPYRRSATTSPEPEEDGGVHVDTPGNPRGLVEVPYGPGRGSNRKKFTRFNPANNKRRK